MLATQAVDVVVSDFNMPGPSGLELLTTIRQDHHEIILVLVTAYGTDALEEQVRRVGMGYLTKPFEPSTLVQLIMDLVQGEGTRGGTENASRITDKLVGTSRIIPEYAPTGDAT